MLKYRSTVNKSLSFAKNPLRWLPVFIVDAFFFNLLVFMVFLDSQYTGALLKLLTNPETLLPNIGSIFIIGITWFLLRLWVTGAVIHQTHKEKEFNKSWKISFTRFPVLLAALVIIMIITTIAGLVPIINNLLTILVGIIFFFVLQSIMIKKKSTIGSLKESYYLFRKHFEKVSTRFDNSKFLALIIIIIILGAASFNTYFSFVLLYGHSGLGFISTLSGWITFSVLAFLLFYSKVFRSWLTITVISGIITIIFILPAFFIGSASITQDIFLLAGKSYIPALLLFFLSKPLYLLIFGYIFLLGSSIATVFSLKAQTEFYKQLKKRFTFL